MKQLWLSGRIVITGALSALLFAGCGSSASNNSNGTGNSLSRNSGSLSNDSGTVSGDDGEIETPAPESSGKTRNLSPVAAVSTESSVVNGSNSLGVDLLGTLSGNAVVAPFSASLDLARLRAGAVGETRTAISGVMHLTGLEADVDSAFNDLDLGINGRVGASSLGAQSSSATAGAWSQARYGYQLSYLDTLAENYGLKPSRVDFALALGSADQTVNDWASQSSGGLSTIVTTTEDTRLVIGDAIRLNAAWTEPFDPSFTETSGFQLLDAGTVQVPFMRRTATVGRTSGDGYIALSLPLAGGQQFLVVLPDEGRYPEIQSALTAVRLQQIAVAMTLAPVDLALPKFTVESTATFDLGVASAKGVADFSGIDGTKDLYVSATAHHSRLAVTEAGLQAGDQE